MMAQTVTVNASLAYADANSSDEISITDFVASLSNAGHSRYTQTITTSELALVLPPAVTTPGYVIIINRDPTNYVELRVATGGAKFARLDANGGFAILKLGSGAQAPFAIANSASCIVECLICNT